jgi:hypothetical protein
MTRNVPLRATAVWMLLMAATALTWWLGADDGADLGGGRTWVVLAIPVAFLKVYLIGSEFMEVRTAPRALRLAFGAWVVVLTLGLIAIYLL